MSIKTAIDKLTGKSSKNIEDAISKLDIGGGDFFVVNVSVSATPGQSGGYVTTADKSYADILQAVNSNKNVFVITTVTWTSGYPDDIYYMPLINKNFDYQTSKPFIDAYFIKAEKQEQNSLGIFCRHVEFKEDGIQYEAFGLSGVK